MSHELSPGHEAELSADVREFRYMAEVDFPSGKVILTTGDPTRVDQSAEQWGTVNHGFIEIHRLSTQETEIVFQLADSSFINDFFSTSLGSKTVRVWSYYEFTSDLVKRGDAKLEHSGRISRVRGGIRTATVESIRKVHNFPKRRINPTGGFNWITAPQVITLGNQVITVHRRGLRG